MAGGAVRTGRAQATAELIMATAERLFAEYGVVAVSNRQIGEAAGQGNTAVVGYHFGTRAELVTAIFRKHNEDIERIRELMVARIAGTGELRDWVSCLVCPATEHLAALDSPTWFARFSAQVMTDPVLRAVPVNDALTSAATLRILEGLDGCLSTLPSRTRAERDHMARQLLVHVIAERERALADGLPTPRPTWRDAATGLIDAITGLYLAPVTEDERNS